ncbi:MAG TPA: DUF1003 domain-containing protein [Vitreimonas sp.]|nr:DUF1003 domain-containing protein [Vitreimonas sp.]
MSTSPSQPTQPQSPRRLFRALEAKSLRSRTVPTQIADYLTSKSSTPTFLFLNTLLFAFWIIWNSGLIPQLKPIDPYPFGFLTMVVSLEAIALSIFVLISQNRAAQIATLRDELNLRVNLIAEQEVTKSLQILAEMRTKMGIKTPDPELEEMLQDINASDLEHSIAAQLVRADQTVITKLTKKDVPNLINSLLNVRR